MARKARSEILSDGSYAHIFSRSFDKRKMFDVADDFAVFKKLLLSQKREKGFKLFHYCVMQTHFHMAVGIGSLEIFSRALQAIKWHYTRYYNAKCKRWGPLWRERFGGMLIEDERSLHACGRYIEHNPVKARLVNQAQDWEHSSARHYVGEVKDEMVDLYV